jgi:arginyl-tRNA synthetase
MKMDIKSELLTALKSACISAGISSENTGSIVLSFPENLELGDFTSNVAMVNAKTLGMSPKALAEKIVDKLKNDNSLSASEIISKIEIAGPGFINFTLNSVAISNVVQDINIPNVGNGKKVLVEYSSPNIAKPFTVGHLRSTIIGDSIANTLSVLGFTVIRDNHLGDWGTQFGKLLVAIEKWGSEYGGLEGIQKNENPIKVLVDLYVKFHDEEEKLINSKNIAENKAGQEIENQARAKFRELEDAMIGKATPQSLKSFEIWKACIDLSKKEFDKIYAKLGVKFDPKRGDTEIGESFYVTPDKIKPVMDALNTAKILEESEGAKVVFFGGNDAKKWKYPPLIFEKSDGTSIYATRDLAADYYRLKQYGSGLTILNEVGSEQSLYFKQLFETEKMLGWFRDGERIHIAHGLYRFKDGKMSTRKGNVIWLDDILNEAISRAEKIDAKSAEQVAVAAIKFNDLKRDSAQDIVFDWDEMMNMTGDSGPYLQYSCVRAKSVALKAKGLGIEVGNSGASRPDLGQLDLLEKYLIRFPYTVEFAGQTYKPSVIANYLINLASYFNAFYAATTIVDEKDSTSAYKVGITKVFAEVMEKGLGLLGIGVPERM